MSAAAPAPQGAAPFSLVNQWNRDVLLIGGREPRTLQELLQAKAAYEYRGRMATVKAMATRLRLLDPLLPELAARGVPLHERSINSYDAGKTLRINTPICVRHDDKLHAALLEMGFREVERRSYSSNDDVTLQLGRWLRISIDVSKAPAPSAPEAATGSPPCGA